MMVRLYAILIVMVALIPVIGLLLAGEYNEKPVMCGSQIEILDIIDGKKEVLINDWTKRDTCECCGDEITVCYDNCSHPDAARECNQCEKHFCFDCAEWDETRHEFICNCCK